jgi:uncharacterized membrane-anchored protein YhcB (DUF1043 family)
VVLCFLTQTITAFVQHYSGSFGFWKWVAAGETAAWGFKWISIPVLFTILWFGRKLYRSILVQPERFCGVNHARRGLLASAIVAMLIAMLIGITVPARLEQRKLAREAAIRAQGREIARAFAEYRIKYQTYPADKAELLKRLPDPYGTLAAALKNVDSRTYVPTAEYAANGIEKSRNLRGVAIRNASLSSATDDTPPGGLSFTTYQLRLPGEDKIAGNEDDWIVRDGMVMKLSDVSKGSVGRFVSAGALEP